MTARGIILTEHDVAELNRLIESRTAFDRHDLELKPEGRVFSGGVERLELDRCRSAISGREGYGCQAAGHVAALKVGDDARPERGRLAEP